MRTEWKGAGVTSSEERQGKEEWVCVLGRRVILLGFWDARCDTILISCLPTKSFLNFKK